LKRIDQQQLYESQELGDLVRQYSVALAIQIYSSASVFDKVLDCFIESGQFHHIIGYANMWRYHLDYRKMLSDLYKQNPLKALNFAVVLAEAPGGPPLALDEICAAVDIQIGDSWNCLQLLKDKFKLLQQQQTAK
jgi:hypothetical protein